MSTAKKPQSPFYWTAPAEPEKEGCYVAPTGWYQWTPRGLVYLGESILERVQFTSPEAQG